MSEEVRLLLVNNLSAEDYLIVSNSFYKLEKELETLRKLNDANYKSFIDTNKIIIELEKWCNEEMYADDQLYEKVLDKLQKLKGENK